MDKSNTLAIIDLGGQYAHLIATKFRNMGFSAEIRDPEDTLELIGSYGGVVLSGSPNLSAFDEESDVMGSIIDLDIPILGFCFGHQEISKHYGGKVIRGKSEFGPSTLEIIEKSPIFQNIPQKSIVFMSHGDTVSEIPDGFKEIGFSYSEDGKNHRYAAISDETRKRYGFQYHPEVDDSEYGHEMLRNFANICELKNTWNIKNSLEHRLESIRKMTQGKDVFLLVSGGVDSTVLGELLLKALGPEKVHMLHVDNGFMRENESDEVVRLFQQRIGKNFHFSQSSDRFINALDNISSPEEKRKIIGEEFVWVCEEEMSKLNLDDALLCQGTIYPDTVESGGAKRAKVIKTHHNRVKLMEEMIAAGRVIEPLSDLYKKEVRELGEALGVPKNLIERHPFPGPGLAVRILASQGEYPKYFDEVKKQNINSLLPSGFSGTVLPIPSVGVKADLRSYELPLLIQSDENLNPKVEIQRELMSRVPVLVKEIKGINRVLLNLSGINRDLKPQKAFLTKNRISLARRADSIVSKFLKKFDLTKSVWQFPVVLVPFSENGQIAEMVVLRPVMTVRAMTSTVPLLLFEFYKKVVDEIMKLDTVSTVALDLTTKPPGTIEWE